jgi:fatty acyl-CoA reductase
MMEIGRKMNVEIPFNSILWKPRGFMTKYQAWYLVNVILLHLIPALLLDGLLKLSGNKPLYVNIRCIIYVNICILLIMLYLPATGITQFQIK